jgi:hypothetical protein
MENFLDIQVDSSSLEDEKRPKTSRIAKHGTRIISPVFLPFEITTYNEGEHKRELEKTISHLSGTKSTNDNEAHRFVIEQIVIKLRNQLPGFFADAGIEARIEKISTGEGGYANTESGAYEISPNIVLQLSNETKEHEIVATSVALNMAADQQSGNAFKDATVEEIQQGKHIYSMLVFKRPCNLKNYQFRKMMKELHTLADCNGERFITGHTDFLHHIGVASHFYHGDFRKQISEHKSGIDTILSKNKVDLTTRKVVEKKVYFYQQETCVSNEAPMQNKSDLYVVGIEGQSQRLLKSVRDLYITTFREIRGEGSINSKVINMFTHRSIRA